MSNDQITTETGLRPVPSRESLWERIPLLVTHPGQAFEAVRRRPGWWLPGLIMLVLTSLYLALNCHIIMPETLALTETTGSQREVMQKQIDMFSDPPGWLRVVVGLGAGLTVWVVMVISGLVYHLFLRLSEGKGTTGQSLGVAFWAGLIPVGLKTILSWVLLIATGSSAATRGFGLAILFRDQDPNSVAYLLATFFGDVFAIWSIILMIIGFAIVHQIERKRAAVVTIAIYALIAAVQIGISVLGAAAGRSGA